jgi:hypothetical protein
MKRLKNIQKVVSKQKNQQRKKEKNVETIDDLKLLLLEYQRKLFQSNYTSLRLKDLLSRKSTLRLSETKLEKMKKKLLDAEEDYSFSQLALDQISFRMSQIS